MEPCVQPVSQRWQPVSKSVGTSLIKVNGPIYYMRTRNGIDGVDLLTISSSLPCLIPVSSAPDTKFGHVCILLKEMIGHNRIRTRALAVVTLCSILIFLFARAAVSSVSSGGKVSASKGSASAGNVHTLSHSIAQEYVNERTHQNCLEIWYPDERDMLEKFFECRERKKSHRSVRVHCTTRLRSFLKAKVDNSFIDLRSFYMARAHNIEFQFEICREMGVVPKEAAPALKILSFFAYRNRHHNRILVRELQKLFFLGKFLNVVERAHDQIAYGNGDGPGYNDLYKKFRGNFAEITASAQRVDENVGAILAKFDMNPYDPRREITEAQTQYWQKVFLDLSAPPPTTVPEAQQTKLNLLRALNVMRSYTYNLGFFIDVAKDMIAIAKHAVKVELANLLINTLDLLLRVLDPTFYVSMVVAPVLKTTLRVTAHKLLHSEFLRLQPSFLTAQGRARMAAYAGINSDAVASQGVSSAAIGALAIGSATPSSELHQNAQGFHNWQQDWGLGNLYTTKFVSAAPDVVTSMANNLGIVADIVQIANGIHNIVVAGMQRRHYELVIKEYERIAVVNAKHVRTVMEAITDLDNTILSGRPSTATTGGGGSGSQAVVPPEEGEGEGAAVIETAMMSTIERVSEWEAVRSRVKSVAVLMQLCPKLKDDLDLLAREQPPPVPTSTSAPLTPSSVTFLDDKITFHFEPEPEGKPPAGAKGHPATAQVAESKGVSGKSAPSGKPAWR